MASPEILVADAIKRFPEVERIVLFGSRARGDARSRSDIDLAVACPAANSVRWFDILDAAEAAPTLLKIDLVRLEAAPANLRRVIEAEGRVLYERR